MTNEPQKINPSSMLVVIENQRLKEKCARQRRELKRLNTIVLSMRGAMAWFRDSWDKATETSPQAKVRLHHRNNLLRRDLGLSEEKVARLENALAEWRAGDRALRPVGCQCTWEQGDSPCPVHPSIDDATTRPDTSAPVCIQATPDSAPNAGEGLDSKHHVMGDEGSRDAE
jgi:hypothetical protein